jgi:Cu(I)/Ag(I) efflux system membrane fusion protein
MAFVPVYAEETAGPTGLKLDSALTQRLGVRTTKAWQGSVDLVIGSAARASFDETRIRDLYVPVDGWLRSLPIVIEGQRIKKGEVLFEVYSPSLFVIDSDYRRAAAQGTDSAQNPFLQGLRAIGLTDDMIEGLREGKRKPGWLRYVCETDSVLTKRSYREGAFVSAGSHVLQVAVIDPMWVIAEVPTTLVGSIRVGDPVVLQSPKVLPSPFSGTVDFINASVDPTTRTTSVRVVVPNTDARLKDQMFIEAEFRPTVAIATLVPREAVIRGERDRVVVVRGDRFESREVTLGREGRTTIEVTAGLDPGDRVVTTGLFLVDSEINLRTGLSRFAPTEPRPLTDEPPR